MYRLEDDGTLDTVVNCFCPVCEQDWTERIDAETASEYRDDSGAMMDLTGLMDELDVYCECGE